MKITLVAATAISHKVAQLVAELNLTLREGATQGMTYDSDIMTMHSANGSYPIVRITPLVRPSNLVLE